MIPFNPFQITPGDKSVVYLGQIFGGMHGVIPTPDQAVGTISLLGTMFKTFNSVILAVGALMVVYITVVGVMMTAHEGQFMGKNWNGLWVPIRVVLGIAALIPMGSGYSTLQVIMMWVIVQGIGAADTLWNTALSYVNIVGSPFAEASLPSVGIKTSMNILFQGLVCDEASRVTDKYDWAVGKGRYYCASGSKLCSISSRVENGSYSLGPNGSCGEVKFCDAKKACSGDGSDLKCLSCKAQTEALNIAIPILRGVAKDFVARDMEYRDFYATSAYKTDKKWDWIYKYCDKEKKLKRDECCVPPKATLIFGNVETKCKSKADSGKGSPEFLDPINAGTGPTEDLVPELYWPYGLQPTYKDLNFISAATKFYNDELQKALTTYIAEQGQQQLQGSLAEAQQYGWILAGSYYYTIADMNTSNFKESMPEFSVMSSTSNTPPPTSPMTEYRNDYAAAKQLLSAVQQTAQGQSQLAGSGQGTSEAMSATNDAFGDVNTTMSGSVGDRNTNPLAQLQSAGMTLLIIAEVLFAAYVVITFVGAFFGNIGIWVFGTGANNPTGPTILTIYFLLVPLFFIILGILISFGGLLGVYVPLIPYIVFTFGAIGWMMMVLEAMVAGPLVALGIISPAGHHEMLGKAEPGLMLLFSVFLRPGLMIFGLIAAMLLASVVVGMINTAFWSVVVPNIGTQDPIGWILFLVAYVYLIVGALNKCFQAIYIIPERVMTWIGAQSAGHGEAEGLAGVQKAMDSGIASTEQGMKAQRGEAERMGQQQHARAREGEQDEHNKEMLNKVSAGGGGGKGGGESGKGSGGEGGGSGGGGSSGGDSGGGSSGGGSGGGGSGKSPPG